MNSLRRNVVNHADEVQDGASDQTAPCRRRCGHGSRRSRWTRGWLDPQRVRPHADHHISLHAHDLQSFHHVHLSEPRTGGIQHLPGLRSSLLAPAQVRTQPDRGFRVHPDLCVCGTLLGVRQLIDDLTHERVRIDAQASGAFGSDDVLRQVQWVVGQPEYAQQPTRRSQLLDLHRVPVAAKDRIAVGGNVRPPAEDRHGCPAGSAFHGEHVLLVARGSADAVQSRTADVVPPERVGTSNHSAGALVLDHGRIAGHDHDLRVPQRMNGDHVARQADDSCQSSVRSKNRHAPVVVEHKQRVGRGPGDAPVCW